MTAAGLVCGIVFCALAADNVRWNTTVYDFGTFAESDGVRAGQVSFRNTGSSPVSIIDVRTSCGCTVADYETGPVAPGDSAVVRFTYNPAGRPGVFEKKIRIFIDSLGASPEIVRIKGKVIGSASTLGLNYPVERGDLRLGNDTIDLGSVRPGHSRHGVIAIYNQGTDTIAPELRDLPDGVDANITPGLILPGEQAFLGVFVNIPFKWKGGAEWHRTIRLSTGPEDEGFPVFLNLKILEQKDKDSH